MGTNANSPSLAKFGRPRLHGPVPRDRLFALLDGRQNHSVVWISGPPGAGKTTLVASYLQSRRVRGFWYQVDAGDTDPASLFLYLGELAKSIALQQRAALPYLTPEFQDNLAGFARRFFRDFYARMRPGDVLVLDNCHDAMGTLFDSVLREACQEVPDGIGIIAVSRSAPPSSLARLGASGSLVELRADQLRLTVDEVHQIVTAANRGVADVEALHALADGWAAGLIVLLATTGRSANLPGSLDRMSKEAIFKYFAGEVFDRLPETTRELLLCTSLFPEVTAEMAAAITRNPEAGKILDGLYRHNFFTSRKGETELSYQYHDLFRDFLRIRFETDFPPARVTEVRVESARILEVTGRIEEAVQQSLVAKDWQTISRLVREHGEILLNQGRWQTLQHWITEVPQVIRGAAPWLQYWLGMATLESSPDDAIPQLEAAFEGFDALDDAVGRACCAVGACAAIYYSHDDYTRFDRWMPIIRAFLDTADCPPGSLLEARAVTTLVNVAYHRAGDEASFRDLAERGIRCLRTRLPAMQRVETATRLLISLALRADLDLAREVVAIAEPVAAAEGFPRLQKSWWDWAVANYLVMVGAQREALDRFSEVIAASREFGARGPLLAALFRKLLLSATMTSERPRMPALMDEIEAAADPHRPVHQFARWQSRSYVVLHSSPNAFDIDAGERTVMAADKAGSINNSYAARLVLSLALRRAGQIDAALDQCRAARTFMTDTCLWPARAYQGLREASLLLATGRHAEARFAVGDALRICGERRGMGYVMWAWFDVPEMLEFALAEGIEVDTCRRIIRHFDIVPPTPHPEWPWQVRIRALGGFALEVDAGGSTAPSRKPPHRVLELLKAIIAYAPGATVGQLTEALWPDAEGDQAQANLDSSLHRLRKLLGRDAVVVQREGRVSINDRVCWVDSIAFDALTAGPVDSGPALDDSALARLEQAHALYGGHLFDGESFSWMTSARERLRSRYQRVSLALAATCEAQGRDEDARRVYERLLELEPASELCYRHLMLGLKRAGRLAEARDVYQRCRRVLSSTLAAMPSAATVAVFESLDADGPASSGERDASGTSSTTRD